MFEIIKKSKMISLADRRIRNMYETIHNNTYYDIWDVCDICETYHAYQYIILHIKTYYNYIRNYISIHNNTFYDIWEV